MRLTERRKVRGQYSSTSGPRDGGDDSLDIVDISQSSFESELDVDRNTIHLLSRERKLGELNTHFKLIIINDPIRNKLNGSIDYL